ncbi:hypothetical protein OSTOST_21650 [Ostertagia ostertagi]
MVSPGPLLGDATSLPSLCHGFCGRYKLPAGNDSGTETIWSECGPCKWGNGAVDHRVCSPCQSELSPYDWLFLLFMAILPLLVHCFCVHWHTPKNTSRVHELCEHLCCILECIICVSCCCAGISAKDFLSLYGDVLDRALRSGWCALSIVSVYRDVVEFMRKCSAFSCRRQNIDEGDYKSRLHLADAHGDAYGQHDSPGIFSAGYLGSKGLSCELSVAIICSSAAHILHVDYRNKPILVFCNRPV